MEAKPGLFFFKKTIRTELRIRSTRKDKLFLDRILPNVCRIVERIIWRLDDDRVRLGRSDDGSGWSVAGNGSQSEFQSTEFR